MSYCSRSCRRRLTVLDFKSWAFSRIFGHCQQHLYCACAETVIYALPCVNLDTAVRLADPDFLLGWKTSAILRCLRSFLHLIFWLSAIFLLPVCWTYWPRKYTTRVDPHVDNFHQVWRPYVCGIISTSVGVTNRGRNMADIQNTKCKKINVNRRQIAEILHPNRKSGSANRTAGSIFTPEVHKYCWQWPQMRLNAQLLKSNTVNRLQ